jgi:hypothetical protein
MAVSGRSGGEGALIAALAAGAAYADAAKHAGVSERTVRRRLDDPAFKREVGAARDAMVSQAVARLSAATTAAVDALRALLDSPLDFARLAAARNILELALKFREHDELSARVAALEERLGKEGDAWKPRAG